MPTPQVPHLHFAHLAKDKKLQKIMIDHLPPIQPKVNIMLLLMNSIMSQQLSVKVAEVIYARFLQLYNGKHPSATQVLSTPTETLRAIGLSNAKVSYVHNVARFAETEDLSDEKLHQLSNEEILTYLTQIKGVGQWSVEMLLMFHLGREDVFSLGDYSLQQAMIKLYKLDPTDKKALKIKLLKLSEKWAPYRSYACRYLWKWRSAEGK